MSLTNMSVAEFLDKLASVVKEVNAYDLASGDMRRLNVNASHIKDIARLLSETAYSLEDDTSDF